MELLRDLSAKQLIEALQQGLEQNLSPAELTSLQPRLASFESVIGNLHEGHQATTWLWIFCLAAARKYG